MAVILVSGASGFLGSWVCRELSKEKDLNGHSLHTVVGVDDLSGSTLDNISDLSERPNFHFIKGDCGDYSAMEEVFATYSPQIFFHVASCAREGASAFSPRHIAYTNFMISAVMFELAIKYKITKIIFTSSMAVMGAGRVPFMEDDPKSPVDVYGTAKAAVEDMLIELANVHEFAWTIIRPHNIVGVGQSLCDPFRNVAGIFANRIMRGEPIFIFGKDHIRAFSPVEDSIGPLIKCADIQTANQRVIFLGGSQEITIDELADEIISHFPEYKKPERIYLPPRPLEVPHAWCNTRLSEEILGYDEKTGWKQSIANFCAWAKKKGPVAWRVDDLPLRNEKTPLPWKQVLDARQI